MPGGFTPPAQIKDSGVPAGLQSRGAAYKNNMYALLGKPGYEERRAELEARL